MNNANNTDMNYATKTDSRGFTHTLNFNGMQNGAQCFQVCSFGIADSGRYKYHIETFDTLAECLSWFGTIEGDAVIPAHVVQGVRV